MTDPLCGPSNPLQSFKNHTQVDRTLQQDRSAAVRSLGTEQFRTQNPQKGALDAEFRAFEAQTAHPLHLLPKQLSAQEQSPIPQYKPQLTQDSFDIRPAVKESSAAWIANFDNLNLTKPHTSYLPPTFLSSSTVAATRATSNRVNNNWHDEFSRQDHRLPSAKSTNGFEPAGSFSSRSSQLHLMTPPNLHHFQQPHFCQDEQTQLGDEQEASRPKSSLDHAAFAAAFAEAEHMHQTSHEEHTEPLLRAGATGEGNLNTAHITQLQSDHESQLDNQLERPAQPSTIRIGSDIIQPSVPPNQQPEQTVGYKDRDSDELARTAGLLVASVSHDTSPKFEQSQFLTLMRRLRDREVEVQGKEIQERRPSERIREAESQHERDSAMKSEYQPPSMLHPGGTGYPITDAGVYDGSQPHVQSQRQWQKPAEMDPYHQYDHWASGGIGTGDDRLLHGIQPGSSSSPISGSASSAVAAPEDRADGSVGVGVQSFTTG